MAFPLTRRRATRTTKPLEAQAADLKARLVGTVPQSSADGRTRRRRPRACITSRAASKAFFIDGTNRAMFRFTMLNHMCRDMEQVHDTSRAPDRIRQDVSRSPGGDARVFLNGCIGCHSGMDPMAQAFAYYNFQYDKATDPTADAGFLKYNDTGDIDADHRHARRSQVLQQQHDVPVRLHHDERPLGQLLASRSERSTRLGRRIAGQRRRCKVVGKELANSDAFAECQVEKVFENVCLRRAARCG